MDKKIPISSGAAGYYTAENASGALSEPTFPGNKGCTCIAPDIYYNATVNVVCRRCKKPFAGKEH